MKKIILLSCLTGALMADNSFYVGVDFGKADNTDKVTVKSGVDTAIIKHDNTYSDLKIKLGIEADTSTNFQLTFSKITYDTGVFISSTGTALYEAGVDIIKEFEITSSLSPFIKLGAGYGYMDSQVTAYGNVKEFSTNVGAGLSYKLVDHIYTLVGVDYIYRHWSDTSDGTFTYETRGSALKPYIGVNYKF